MKEHGLQTFSNVSLISYAKSCILSTQQIGLAFRKLSK